MATTQAAALKSLDKAVQNQLLTITTATTQGVISLRQVRRPAGFTAVCPAQAI